MEPGFFRFILKFSRKEQILLVVATLLAFPFLYMTLDLPKTIINEAIGGRDFPREVFGYELDQVPYLLLLCGIFLALVLINGGFKYFINVYRGIVGERMLRRLRYQLLNRVLRFPLPQFRKTSQGEIVSMITAETEPLSNFVGDSIALPAFQGGTLLTILVFMFVQDPVLGLAAVALYPIQAYIIPKIQRRLNQLRKERIVRLRKLSERIGEVVNGMGEVHTHDTSQYELADFSDRLGEIYSIRYDIYRLKFLIKFVNNFLAQVTPFFFFSIGGYLVIRGNLSFGALVAVLAAYKDLLDPWKELLKYYQDMADARVKYDLLTETFSPPGMMQEELLVTDTHEKRSLVGELVVANADLREEDEGESTFEGTLSLRLPLPQSVAVLGGHGSGKDRLGAMVAGVFRPRSGSITINGVAIGAAPESLTGRRLAYVAPEPTLRSGTLRENILYSLMHRPVHPAQYSEEEQKLREHKRRDALLAGNSEYDVNADWIDREAIGAEGDEALNERLLEVVTIADMDEDVYKLGLQGLIDPNAKPELADRVLAARNEVKQRLEDPEVASFVELFDEEAYNTNMTVAENLIFGTPRDESFAVDNLADNAYVRKVLHETGLMTSFLDIGRQVAEVMVDLFADVEPDSPMFERFSFIHAEDLPVFRSVLSRTAEADLRSADEADRRLLLSLPFKLIPARHRLGVIDEAFQDRLLEARRVFAAGFGEGPPPVDFFDRENYSPAISIQDNILFGRLVYGKARAATTVGALIGEVVEKLDLRRDIMEVGLDYSIGIGGTRLTGAQRQKVSIARAVIKRPDVLVLNEATAVLDDASQTTVMRNLLRELEGRGLIWLVHRASLGKNFDQALVMENGRVAEQGSYSELNQPGTLLKELAAAS